MKRFLLFSIGMVLSLTAGMAVSEAIMSDEEFLSAIFSEAGISQSTENDATELKTLAGTEAPFSGLYLYMLQNIMNGPRDAAIEEVANLYGYTEEEIESIVLEGSSTPIIDKQKANALAAQSAETADELEEAELQGEEDVDAFIEGNELGDFTEAYLRWHYETYEAPPTASQINEPLTNDYLLKWYTTISDAYDRELTFQQDNRRLAYEALASEMFLNNDLSDSANIDLLYDLDLIHYLLFGELITYPDRSGDAEVETASEEEDGEEPLALFNVPEPREEAVILAADSIDPYVCYGDEDLANALDNYETAPPDTGDALPEEEEGGFDYDIDDDGTVGEDEPDGEDEPESDPESDDEAEEESPDVNDFLADVEGAFAALDGFLSSLEQEPGDWTRGLPCNDVFCIEVKLVNETEDPEAEDSSPMQVDDFDENANCVACHTAFIKERLKETMDKSLVPSKISMNWFEDATCKEAGSFVNLDFNIYAIKKPIDLDTGDEIDEKADEEIDELKNKLFSIGGITIPGGTKTTLGKTLDDLECESILNISDISGIDQSIDDLLAQCQKAAEQNAKEVQEVFNEFVFNAQSQSTSDLYQQVSAELYTMLLYFQTFQEGLKATYETDNPPIPALLGKGYCQ